MKNKSNGDPNAVLIEHLKPLKKGLMTLGAVRKMTAQTGAALNMVETIRARAKGSVKEGSTAMNV